MTGFNDEQVWLGTWGKVWIDGDLMSEATAFRAEVTISYEDVKRVQNLMTGQKMTGIAGEGEITLHKVDSYVLKKVAAKIKAGKIPDITIESSWADPNGVGEQRIAVKHVKFEKITLIDWETGNIGEESYSFRFSDYDIKAMA
ncbi:MAG: phage tail tube protein [Eubacterium sp.]|nr:phage tail tube protein [Candidatus Colimonas fimequi]